MKSYMFLIAGAVLCAGSSLASPICPTTSSNSTGADVTGCGVLITYSLTGPTLTTPGTGAYDGSEDTTVGIINNSSKPLSTVTLTASNDAFGFDGDGIQTFASINGVVIPTGGATGYEGPNMTYDLSGISGGNGTLVVDFNSPLAVGASTYFSLEGDPSVGGGIVVGSAAPEPGSIAMLGGGLLAMAGLALRRHRRNTSKEL